MDWKPGTCTWVSLLEIQFCQPPNIILHINYLIVLRHRLGIVRPIVWQWQSGKLHAENRVDVPDFHIITWVFLGSLVSHTGKCDIFPYLIYGWNTGNLLSTFVADGEEKRKQRSTAYRLRFPNNWFTIQMTICHLIWAGAKRWEMDLLDLLIHATAFHIYLYIF